MDFEQLYDECYRVKITKQCHFFLLYLIILYSNVMRFNKVLILAQLTMAAEYFAKLSLSHYGWHLSFDWNVLKIILCKSNKSLLFHFQSCFSRLYNYKICSLQKGIWNRSNALKTSAFVLDLSRSVKLMEYIFLHLKCLILRQKHVFHWHFFFLARYSYLN